MGQSNQQLGDALKRLSSVKYGHPRAQVEREIFERLKTTGPAKPGAKSAGAAPGVSAGAGAPKTGGGSSFLDEWLAKRKKMTGGGQSPAAANPIAGAQLASPPQPGNAGSVGTVSSPQANVSPGNQPSSGVNVAIEDRKSVV